MNSLKLMHFAKCYLICVWWNTAIPAVVSIVLVSLSFLCLPPPYCEVLPDVESIPRVQCQNSIIKIIK